MKKTTSLLTMVLMLFFAWHGMAQATPQSIVIGTGTDNDNGSASGPIDRYYKAMKYQTVYTAAELTSAGLTPYDELTALGFSISEDLGGDYMHGYTIKIGHTSATDASAAIDDSNAVVVKGPFDYTPTATAAGEFDMITFDTNFVWNGSDNIYVQVCSDGPNTYATPYGGVRNTAMTKGSRYYRSDTYTACDKDTNLTNDNRPNIKFNYIDGTPPSCIQPSNLTVVSITAPSNATFSWDAVSNASGYNYEIQPQGTPQGTPGAVASGSTTNTSFTATNLVNGTAYTLYVQSDCGGGDTSEYATLNFYFIANDICSNAIPLTIYTQGAGSGNEIAASTNHATDSGQHPSCDDTGTNLDLWYSFTAPASGHLKLITGGATGSDIEAAIYDSCGGAELDCQDRSSEKIFRGLTPGQTYILQVWHDSFNKGDFTLVLEDAPLIVPVYTTTVNPDCANNQFTVDIDITDLGGSSSVTVSDDQGSTSQQVSAAGTITFGPYASGTTVVFTLTSDDDANVTDTATVSYACPPANDACADATEVATLPYSATEDASGATNNDGFIAPSGCGSGMNDGVWYTFTVGTAGTIQIEVTPNAWDAEVAVYTGGCGSFTCVDNADSNSSGGAETITFAADAGTQYWVNVGHWSNSTDYPEGSFDISITSSDGATLSLADNVIEGFNMSPNPVTNLLTLQADDNIQQIKVYNVLGQVVLKAMPNAKVVRLNTQLLPAGAYIVKVKAGNQIGAYHLIKQ